MNTDTATTPRIALAKFYKAFNLGDDGGQSKFYVKIELTKKIFVCIPNVDSRRKAVLRHDIHHLLTGYSGELLGETEISAWELSSGCTSFPFAWGINLTGMLLGAFINTRGIFTAWKKGRGAKNLYDPQLTDAYILDTPIPTLKENLHWTQDTPPRKARAMDYVSFLGMLLVAGLISLLSVVFIPFVLLFTVYVALTQDV